MGANDEASTLARRAEALARTAEDQKRRRSQNKALVRPGAAVLSALFESPALSSPLARRTAGHLMDHRAQEDARHLESQYRAWYADAETFLGRVSIAYGNVTRSGNSRRLQNQLATTKSSKTLASRLSRGCQLMEKLASQELVYNAEIPVLLGERARARYEEQRLSLEGRVFAQTDRSAEIDLPMANRSELEAFLAPFPESQLALVGALDAMAGNGKDRHRQAMTSCRLALESMARHVTGTSQWKSALRERHGKSRGKLVGALYELLSSAAHSGRVPSQADAELAVRQTIAVCCWMAASAPPIELMQR